MRTPVFPAVGWINRENILRGGKDQSTVDHDGATVEILMQMGVVAAEYSQAANVLRIDLAQWRVSLRSEGPVIARPASGVGCCCNFASFHHECSMRATRASKGVNHHSCEGDGRPCTEI